jgi:acyl carrier protein
MTNAVEQAVVAKLAAVGAISKNALKKRYGCNYKKLKRSVGDSSGLGLDSLQMLQLIIGLEVELGVKIADDELTPAIFDTVATVTSFVERKLMEQH